MPARTRAPKRCKKANVFPCKGECVRRYHWKSGKEQHCRNLATGIPATFLEWARSQGQRKKVINTKRKAAGMPLLRSDSAGYLVTPGKNSKGKLPESYKQIIEKAEKIGNQSTDLAIKQKAQDIVDKAVQGMNDQPKATKKTLKPTQKKEQEPKQAQSTSEKTSKAITKTEKIKNARAKAFVQKLTERLNQAKPAKAKQLTTQTETLKASRNDQLPNDMEATQKEDIQNNIAQSSKLKQIGKKIKSTKNSIEAFKSLTDEELSITHSFFKEKNASQTLQTQLNAEIERRSQSQDVNTRKGYSREDQAKLATPHLKNLYGIAMGEDDARDPSTIAKQAKILFSRNKNKDQQSKIKRLLDEGLSEYEANGVAVWIGTGGNYEAINKAIYDHSLQPGQYLDYGESAGIYASQGLRKLQPYNHEKLARESTNEGLTVLKDGYLERHIEIPENNFDAFLKPYREAVGVDEFKEPTFFAATMIEEAGFEDANVKFRIKPKGDDTGQGRAVDNFKNDCFEGEVVYPPYSRFNVLGVEKNDSSVQVFVSKQKDLPEKYQGLTRQELLERRPELEQLQKAMINFFIESEGKTRSEQKQQMQALNPPIKSREEAEKIMMAVRLMFRTVKANVVIEMEEI